MTTNVRLVKIGHRIAELRHAAGIRQEDLAEKIGLSRSSVANIEIGRQELSITHLQNIADVLGSSVAEIACTPSMPWLELARRTFKSEREYQQLAEQCWRDHDYLTAIRYRGIAEGLQIARQHHVDVINDKSGGDS